MHFFFTSFYILIKEKMGATDQPRYTDIGGKTISVISALQCNNKNYSKIKSNKKKQNNSIAADTE